MKVIVKGETVMFNCTSCGCIFKAGIYATKTDDGENYYTECPMCGAECHADVNARDSYRNSSDDALSEVEHEQIKTISQRKV